MFWGFSDALNLYEEYTKQFSGDAGDLNCLLYGGGDPRHILQTMAKSYQHSSRIKYYWLEGCIEVQARNLLLTAIALEDRELLSLRGKTHLFMDVYGNTLLRPSSAQYLEAKGRTLTRIVTDATFAQAVAPIFHLAGLKYRERDQLVAAFEFWREKPEYKFEIAKYWDAGLRSNLGARYDHRNGAFDWDLQMTLKDQGAKQICVQEYKQWRDTGIAFTFPEYEQTRPNKSLAVQLLRTGSTFCHRGYVGDMNVGPYITFGNGCVDESFLKSNHGVNQFRATDVTERNLFEMLHELQEKTQYVHDPKNVHAYGSVYLAQGKVLSGENATATDVDMKSYEKPFLPFENSEIHLLSVEDIIGLQDKDQWKGKFDVVFVAANYFPFVRPTQFVELLKPNAVVLFETKNYSLLKKEARQEFLAKVKQLAKDCKLTPITNFNINLPYAVVKYKNEA